MANTDPSRQAERRSYPTVPHVEYSLTLLGREVGQHVQVLADWIESKMPPPATAAKPGRQIIRAGRVMARRASAPRPPAAG